MSARHQNEELVELADLDELLRQVERLVDHRDWDGLVDLRGASPLPPAIISQMRI